MKTLKTTVPSLVLTVLLATLSQGCISISSYHTARPIKPGDTEIGIVMEMAGVNEAEGIIMNSPQLNVRRGATNTLDVGLRAGGFGFGLDANYLFFDNSSIALSINPAINWDGRYIFGIDEPSPGNENGGLIDSTSYTLLTTYAALLADLGSMEYLAITLGLKGGLVSQLGEDASDSPTYFVGGSLGVKVFLDGIYLIPEVNLIYLTDAEQMAWTAGMGLMF